LVSKITNFKQAHGGFLLISQLHVIPIHFCKMKKKFFFNFFQF